MEPRVKLASRLWGHDAIFSLLGQLLPPRWLTARRLRAAAHIPAALQWHSTQGLAHGRESINTYSSIYKYL